MFTETRNRLTKINTAILAAFIFTFVVVSFSGLTWGIIYELKQEVKLIAQEEADEQLQIFIHSGKFEEETDNEDYKGSIFHYLVAPDGTILVKEEPILELRDVVLARVLNWELKEGKAKIYSAVVSDGRTLLYIMTSRSIYNGQQLLGTVYLGKDITSYYVILMRVLFIFTGVTILLLMFASWVGHFLSGRAIIPIKKSYIKQREFVADASHELRTPLTILLTSTDVLQGDEDNKLSSFSKQVLDDMKDEILKMSKIVGDLSTLARADAAEIQLLKESFDIYSVVARVVRSLQQNADRKQIQLELTGPDELLVYADRGRIDQLISILVDNAIKYTPEKGTVRIRIELLKEHNTDLVISVEDNGVGISKEHQEYVFDRFYRVDKSRSREIGGTGLGLAIAKWIAGVHDGVISVQSVPGQGSIFSIKFRNMVVVREE